MIISLVDVIYLTVHKKGARCETEHLDSSSETSFSLSRNAGDR